MVLQGAGNNFRGRRRTRIDQHNDRQAIGRISTFREIALNVGFAAAALRHDFSARQEKRQIR